MSYPETTTALNAHPYYRIFKELDLQVEKLDGSQWKETGSFLGDGIANDPDWILMCVQ